MSIDRSLKVKGALTRHRNVLKRDERIERLKEEERWTEEESLFGLPKVAHRKSHAGKKAKEEAAAAVEGVPGVAAGEAAPTTEAAAAKPEAGKKAAEKTAAAAKPAAAKAAASKPAAKPAAGKKEK